MATITCKIQVKSTLTFRLIFQRRRLGHKNDRNDRSERMLRFHCNSFTRIYNTSRLQTSKTIFSLTERDRGEITPGADFRALFSHVNASCICFHENHASFFLVFPCRHLPNISNCTKPARVLI